MDSKWIQGRIEEYSFYSLGRRVKKVMRYF